MRKGRRSWTTGAMGIILLLFFTATTKAQIVDLSKEAYILPPQELIDLVTAPRHLNVTLRDLGTDGEHFLITRSDGLPTLKIYAKPFVNLGESEFDHTANRSRRFTLNRDVGFELFNYKTGVKIEIVPPPDCWVSNASWSADGLSIAYFVHNDNETHIYVADVKTGRGRRITRTPVLATMVTSFDWAQDGKQILTVLVPERRDAMPVQTEVATEPKVRLTAEGKTPNRTYPNLMQTPHDMRLAEWLLTGQLALIDINTRKMTAIGEPAMYRSIDIAPDGKYLRLTIMQKPFSYIVPLSNAGTVEGIYDLQGKMVTEIQKRELRLSTAGGGRGEEEEQNGRRSLSWRPDGVGMSFMQLEPRLKRERDTTAVEEKPAEPEDAGKRKDRVMHWLPPYDSASVKVIYESTNRIGSVDYSPDCQTLFLSETQSGNHHLYAVNLSDTSKKYTLCKYKADDIYKNPGSLMNKRGDKGGTAVRISSDGEKVYLSGTKYDKKPEKNAPLPFIDRVTIKTGEKERIFESGADVYEEVSTVADDDLHVIFTARQSPTMIPDSYMRDLRTGDMKKLTSNKDYTPDITRAVRKRFKVERVDGFKFWGEITLPHDYREGTRLPAMFWFYPSEFADQKAYDERSTRYNKNVFPRIGTRSMEALTLFEYAVVEPDCPIVGAQGEMNDNYVQDLRNNLWAVIDSLDKKGYVDRDRLAIGGHSYGAFSTANALVHTPFFKAGIAGDGNYNRTLTPMSFQNERRFLWDARETYFDMSPFLYADQLNGALLMYHGMDDDNEGTFLINSERMFEALNGLGKTAALYIYPYEHHGPATIETQLDMWARWVEWLDKYVKNPQRGREERAKKKEEGKK